jgi:hypothetical protein
LRIAMGGTKDGNADKNYFADHDFKICNFHFSLNIMVNISGRIYI